MRYYIDEYFGDDLIHNFNDIKGVVLQKHNDGCAVHEIIDFLIEWLYIFKDDVEKKWYEEVVNNIIDGKPIKNRYTNEVYV
jgi:hypothetical protein